jgi:hypothetical protein
MDVENVDENPLESREPSVEDLLNLCRELNDQGARYMVIGGFAIAAAGYPRMTGDVDLLMDTSPENEARVYKALEILPDKAVRELKPGEVSQYNVVRVADEIVVDLMMSAGGIRYEEAAGDVVIRTVQGVPIPFASPRLLWRMKFPLRREKDLGDLDFLSEYFRTRGEIPPEC